MDVLSSVVSLLELKTLHCGGFSLGPNGGVCVPASSGVKFYAVISGECWLHTEWDRSSCKLEVNHCFLFPQNKGFTLSTSQLHRRSDITLFSERDCGKVTSYGGGGTALVIGAHLGFSGVSSDLLLQGLPPLIHFAPMPERSRLLWLLDSLSEEFRAAETGATLATQHLAQLIFIQAMRTYMATESSDMSGWMRALTDKKIAKALSSMYERPEHKWTVAELGRLVGMSRAAFARRFNELTGESPLDHMTRWRMAVASQRLNDAQVTVAEIALSLGYVSASAFSKTFRRTTGVSPRELRQAGASHSHAN